MTQAPSAQPPSMIDLTSCDREPIHILDAVQSFGFLLASRPIGSSCAPARTLRAGSVDDLLGLPLDRVIESEAIHHLRGHLQTLRGPDAVDRVFGVRLRHDASPFDVALHLSGAAIVAEAELSTPEHLSASNLVRNMVARLQQTTGLDALCREAVRQMRALTGFDRVMLYRFAADGSGEVIAEAVRSGLDYYLGLHYPASDLHQGAPNNPPARLNCQTSSKSDH